MPKRYAVTPQKPRDRQTYSAVFRTFEGNRVKRSLQTKSLSRATLICNGLVELWNMRAQKVADVGTGIDPVALSLYFGKPVDDRQEFEPGVFASDEFSKVEGDPARDAANWRRVVEEYQNEIDLLRDRNRVLENELEALRGSVLGRMVEARKRMPGLEKILELYEAELGSATEAHRENNLYVANEFVDSLPEDLSLSKVTAEHLNAFFNERAKDAPKPIARRRNDYARVGRFINWVAKAYGFRSPMLDVKRPTEKQLRRERGGIEWHDLDEVENVLEGLDGYWSGIVATLAFAGLQLAELIWLKNEHVNLKTGEIWIEAVEDKASGERHDLKTGNRQRVINIHPERLLPRLQVFVDGGHCGPTFFFARTKEGNPRGVERWTVDGLSTLLRGHPGGKRRKPTEGILPDNMHAMSLRRTFGSLLLRSGKSPYEVSVAMGNTEAVVKQFYARLLGSEVEVDF